MSIPVQYSYTTPWVAHPICVPLHQVDHQYGIVSQTLDPHASSPTASGLVTRPSVPGRFQRLWQPVGTRDTRCTSPPSAPPPPHPAFTLIHHHLRYLPSPSDTSSMTGPQAEPEAVGLSANEIEWVGPTHWFNRVTNPTGRTGESKTLLVVSSFPPYSPWPVCPICCYAGRGQSWRM
jgi:hypothetical protein